MFGRLMVVAALALAVVAAQEPPRPTFRTEANYIRVDAFPTREGTPVTDLTRNEFEVFDQREPQRIEQFERVTIRAAGPQDTPVEPNTVREMRTMVASSRARVLVLFLDTYHVDVDGSHNIRKPLVEALDRVIGPEDLVGVMTPEMSPTDITFARKTTTIDGMLTRHWTWGERDRLGPEPEDEAYGLCYPNVPPSNPCADQNGIAAEMIDRRHEKRTLDALQDLVRFLRGAREERKAILAISNGWLQYRPNDALARPLRCHGAPTLPPIGIDPRTGKPTAKDPPGYTSEGKCGLDRDQLAKIDNEHEFREILDEANAANASFYPIDPRGLAVFDTPIMRTDVPGPPPPMMPPSVDSGMLRTRITSLRTLAEATDGLAIVNSNDLAGGLRRVVDDLTSYYLLGYYSTTRLDGKFHTITVRVKRPGIDVRARRGYLAATREVVASSGGAAPASATGDAAVAAVTAAIAPLASFERDVALRVQAAVGWTSSDPSSAFVAVEGELGSGREFEDLWRSGVAMTIELAPLDGASLASARLTLAAGARTFRVVLRPAQPLAPGTYIVRTGARAADATVPARDTLRITVPMPPRPAGVMWLRRGPSSMNRDTPTADLRFRRNEQVKIEVPTNAAGPAPVRLLDRVGRPLAIPVTAAIRDDPDGTRWMTVQVALAPLAPGDYVLELTEGTDRNLAAFRVVQ